MNILAIVGSPRVTGNTSYLVDQALEEASNRGVQTEKIILSQYRVNPCLAHESNECASFPSCPQEDDTGWILEKFSAADGVILASPVYFHNVSAQMKAFIDRNRFLRRHGVGLKAKSVALIVVATSTGIDDALGALKRFITLLIDIAPEKILVISGYAGGVGEVKTNLPLVEEARKLGKLMVDELSRGSSI